MLTGEPQVRRPFRALPVEPALRRSFQIFLVESELPDQPCADPLEK